MACMSVHSASPQDYVARLRWDCVGSCCWASAPCYTRCRPSVQKKSEWGRFFWLTFTVRAYRLTEP